MAEKAAKASWHIGSRYLALPDNEHTPPEPGQFRLVLCVALLVRCELGSPEVLSSRRTEGSYTSGVRVPEAPMHKNDSATRGKHEVRRARQVCSVKSKPIAKLVRFAPHDQLRLGVFAANAGHQAGACCGRDSIHAVACYPISGCCCMFVRVLRMAAARSGRALRIRPA